MHVHQIFTDNQLRNFNYVIEFGNEKDSAIIIDPWDAKALIEFIEDLQLNPIAIINTHEHWDHTQGNLELVERYQCEVWAHENGRGKIPGLTKSLSKDEHINLVGDVYLKVLDTPGHTTAHLCFLLIQGSKVQAVFTGDTLFNAGVGRCDNGGSVEALYQTISEQFMNLADDVMVYPGHDYLENNLNFTLRIEPSNTNAQHWLKEVGRANPMINPIVTTIGVEKEINTFFRLNNDEIKKSVGTESNSDLEVFRKLRQFRDRW